ncbi:hypothetical protein EG328_000337 [Venturia inaequalis]|uniref:Sema domain-containing protein n=1 Tax=Venturia inaequalis TaxID=5025 RepID=A0A8H3VNZ8_VENIN|nr:hypothetical protein EG328_000337 [Venturia inaequalis]KAE9990348.1 hypothetical protein EG327_001530 [Venturia inaequalis]RDI78366.1 hypothetical protein Vi05172_g11568 [Venturia inaequalis]
MKALQKMMSEPFPLAASCGHNMKALQKMMSEPFPLAASCGHTMKALQKRMMSEPFPLPASCGHAMKIAETSITIPDAVYVIDSGKHKGMVRSHPPAMQLDKPTINIPHVMLRSERRSSLHRQS